MKPSRLLPAGGLSITQRCQTSIITQPPCTATPLRPTGPSSTPLSTRSHHRLTPAPPIHNIPSGSDRCTIMTSTCPTRHLPSFSRLLQTPFLSLPHPPENCFYLIWAHLNIPTRSGRLSPRVYIALHVVWLGQPIPLSSVMTMYDLTPRNEPPEPLEARTMRDTETPLCPTLRQHLVDFLPVSLGSAMAVIVDDLLCTH